MTAWWQLVPLLLGAGGVSSVVTLVMQRPRINADAAKSATEAAAAVVGMLHVEMESLRKEVQRLRRRIDQLLTALHLAGVAPPPEEGDDR